MTYKGMFFTGAWFLVGGLIGLIKIDDGRFLIPLAIGIGCIIRAISQYYKFKKSVTNISLLYTHTDEMLKLLTEQQSIDEIADHFYEKYNIYPIDTIRFATEHGGELLSSEEDGICQ
jgi:hydroxymethylglutaryl-CoA reductase